MAKYIFPIPRNAAVCGFRMETMDGRVVKSVVKEVEAAKKDFDIAMSQGKWAGLLNELEGDGESFDSLLSASK